MLKIRFDDPSDAYIEKINHADANTLSQWNINFLNADPGTHDTSSNDGRA